MSGVEDKPEVTAAPLEMSPKALAMLQVEHKPHAILDVREAWELDICALKDCLHIPLGDLARRMNELPKDCPMIVVCHTGRRSLLATRFLREAGMVQAINLEGGVEAWATDIDPAMQRY